MQPTSEPLSVFLAHMSSLTEAVLTDGYWGGRIHSISQLLGSFDAGILEELELTSPANQGLQRIVRFCLPMFELCKEGLGLDLDPSLLAAMYLWQEVWPPLDDILDSEGDLVRSMKTYNVCLLRAYAFHSEISGESATGDFLTCLFDNLDVERNLADRADPAKIFLRVRLYEVIMEQLPQLPHRIRTAYRSYINAIGIAHDFVDVIDDLKAGQVTFATESFRSVDEHLRFHRQNLEALRVRVEQEFRTQQQPLLASDLARCWITRQCLNAYYDWAFSKEN